MPPIMVSNVDTMPRMMMLHTMNWNCMLPKAMTLMAIAAMNRRLPLVSSWPMRNITELACLEVLPKRSPMNP